MCPVCVPFVSRLPPAVSFYGTGYCTVPERVRERVCLGCVRVLLFCV